MRVLFDRARVALGVLVCGLVTALPVAASHEPNPNLWVGTSGGSWYDSTGWLLGVVPGSDQDAIINTGLVQMQGGPGSAVVYTLTVGNLPDARGAGLGIGQGRLSLYLGGLVVGREGGSSGIVTIGNGGSLFAFHAPVVIGKGGTGTFVVSRGGDLLLGDASVLGEQAGSNGSLFIQGGSVGRSVPGALAFDVADAGRATLALSDGGVLGLGHGGKLYVGRHGGLADVTLTGGSLLMSDRFEVLSASNLALTQTSQLVTQSLATGPGRWLLASGGKLAADVATLADTTQLTFEVGAAGAGLFEAGAVTLDGMLALTFEDGFAPTAGVRFTLLSWGQHSGSFDKLVLPTLAKGLAWDSSRLYVDGSLAIAAVVPEAPTAWLALAGLALLQSRWRSRPKARI